MKFAWKESLAALIVGVLIGVGVCCKFDGKFRRGGWQTKGHFDRMLKKFDRKLNLNDSQKQQTATILEESRQKMKAFQNETLPKFDQIRAETRAKIREILNPDQQKKFDEMHAKWEARAEKRRAEWNKE